MTTEANAYETPLLDRLRSVPFDARDMYSHGGPFKTRLIPYGRHCHDAAAEIARLQAQVDALAGAELSNDEIDAIADGIMEPLDTGDACEEDLDRKVLRRFARACIRAAIAAVGR